MISDCFKKNLEILCCGHISEINGSNPTYVMSFLNKMLIKNLKFMRCYHTLALKLLDEVKV